MCQIVTDRYKLELSVNITSEFAANFAYFLVTSHLQSTDSEFGHNQTYTFGPFGERTHTFQNIVLAIISVVVQAPKFEASPNSMMMIIDMISLYFTHVVHKIVLSEALQLQTRNKLTFFAIIYTKSHVVHIRPKLSEIQKV